MKRFRLITLTLTCSLTLFASSAQARFFLGPTLVIQVTEGDTASALGVQFGTYNLGSGFGLRGTLEVRPPLVSSPAFQTAADLLYSRGEETIFYLGVGGGYANTSGSESLAVSGTLGVDVDTDSLISVFLEAQPRYNLTTDAPTFHVRSGLNVHLGD